MPHPRIAFACLALQLAALSQEAPRQVLFTWRGDTGSTLLVTFQTFAAKAGAARVFWDTAPRDGIVEDYRRQQDGRSFRIPGLDDRWIHHVELTGLAPGAAVYLCAGDPELGISREYRVRTIAQDGRPLRFVTGGDMGPGADTRALLRRAAATGPDFALVGGDIAYANGRLENVDLWDSWLTYWTEEMVRPDGFSIPVVLAIGNHEVDGGYGKTKAEAPFYFGFFDQHENSYFARRFGPDLVVFVLDSGHVAEHGGAQAQWLERALREHAGVRHKAALYHVSLYPSHREFEEEGSRRGREHWAPLFDRYGLTVAFENHDHTWKRSHPIRDNRVERDGVLYLGDGCWGQQARGVTLGGRWYLSRQTSLAHFWQVDVGPDGMVYRAVDRRGRVFDVHPADAPGAAAAAEVFAGLRTFYALPADAVTIEPLPVVDAGTLGTRTSVRVHNRFGKRAEATVTLSRSSVALRLVGGEATGIEPGDRAAIPLELVSDAPLPREVAIVLTVRVAVAADGGLPVILTGNFLVPVAEPQPGRGK